MIGMIRKMEVLWRKLVKTSDYCYLSLLFVGKHQKLNKIENSFIS